MTEDTISKKEIITRDRFFEGALEIPFVNKRTDEIFLIKPITENREVSAHDLLKIVEICSDKHIYKRFFEKKLKGKPYDLEDAKTIVRLGREGWQKKEWFIFFIYDNKDQITGLLDIYTRPNDKEPVRLGYWNSLEHPGLMTYALGGLLGIAKEAGYKQLFATPKADNVSSQRVLENNGFEKKESYIEDGAEWYRFVVDLTVKKAS